MKLTPEFSDRVALITGGGTGIGLATARALLDRGVNVVLNGRREDALRAAAARLDDTGKRVAVATGDIGRPETAPKAVAAAIRHFGRLDILVNNAGIFSPKGFLDCTEQDIDRYLDVILKGTFFACQAAIPEFRKCRGGAIINVGSLWATIAVGATPSSAYSAAKGAVHALTRNLAIEFAAENIRVNAVAPAVVETPVYESFLPPDQLGPVLKSFNAFHPLGRNGQPRDVADAIVYLASPQASWITGAILAVDGGATAGKH